MPAIKSIQFINHPIFRDATFDFCQPDGSTAKNIVLAGENGSGKTRLLEELYYGTKREYAIDAKVRLEHQIIITLDLSDSDFYDIDHPRTKATIAKLIASSDSDSTETFYKIEFFANHPAAQTSVDTPIPRVGEKSKHNQIVTFSLNSAYSTTEINYIAKRPVTGVTNVTLDSGRLEESSDVARDITQLLVDIASQDNDDLALAVRENPTKTVPKSLLNNLRMRRFSTAFAKMFGDSLKYKTVRDNIMPVFEKDGTEVDLNALSSGEKQIVFRSAYLLRNINNLTGAPIFLDEPELSMHPKWARSIYEYYKNLFIKSSAKRSVQTSQVFMATHSADIVGAAIEDDTAIVLSLCLNCGLECPNSSAPFREPSENSGSGPVAHKYSKHLTDEVLPTTTLAELKYFIFGIPSIDLHIQLYSYLQNTFTKGRAIRTVDEFLKQHGAPRKKSLHKGRTNLLIYHTLPTYIRNSIDHPEKALTYTDTELRTSIEFMLNLIRTLRRAEK